jgi:hypothetical protein
MGTPYHYGSRRRRVLVLSPQPPSSSAIDATGSLTIGDAAIAGSSGVAIAATGSLAVDALAVAGSASTAVPTTGSLAVDSVAIAGSSSTVIPATGSLVLGGLTATGSGDEGIPASGGVVVGDVTIAGSAGQAIPATGSLAIDDVSAWGADITTKTPKQVVVPNVSIRPQAGSRRRHAIVVTSNTPNSSPITGALALTRIVMARRWPTPPAPPVSSVVSVQTRVVVGGEPPPHTGGGGSPRPLQSSWIAGAIIPRHPRPLLRAVVTQTRYTQPSRDGVPNQITVASPRRPIQPHAGVLVHPTFKWGVNHGKTPNVSIVARRPTPGRAAIPIIIASPPTSGFGFRPVVDPLVVRYAPRSSVRPRVTVYGLVDGEEHLRPNNQVVARPAPKRAAPRITSISTGEAFAVRPPRPPKPILIPYNKKARPRGLLMVLGLADAFEMPPPFVVQPTIVPFHPRPSDRRRPPLVVASKTGINPRSIPVFDPVVVARLAPAKASPWFFISKAQQLAPPPPPRHDPTSRAIRVAVPHRRDPLGWPRPSVSTSILQPDSERFDKPWDLIAACIAWLRKDARIVAEFGDAKGSETSQKFVSDVELPGTNLPYAVFSEPIEIDGYETRDQTGAVPVFAEGVFHLTVFDSEKLRVRQRADMLSASLTDAPLVFTDGVLIYLRRIEKIFPSVTASGPGASTTMFKRVLEFTYMIGRRI